MDASETQVLEYDIRGQICPSTLLIALREINKYKMQLKTGCIRLFFRTNNRDCLVTIPEAAKNMGYAVDVTKCEEHYLISIGGSSR